MKKRFHTAFLLTLSVGFGAGCVSERSLRNVSPYRNRIGREFRTKSDVFLVRDSRSHYRLTGQRQDAYFPDCHPTFQEFRTGRWQNKSYTLEFIAIIPSETAIRITDIRKISNAEMGVSVHTYGRILGLPEYEDLPGRLLVDPVLPSEFAELGGHRGDVP